MKRYTIIILLLTAVSSGALAGNPVKWLVNGADSLLRKMYYSIDYDTAYISRSPGKIGLKAWGSVSGASLRARGDILRSRLATDVKGTLSLEFDYYDLAVEFATNPTSFKGRNHDYEINFNFYPRRFVVVSTIAEKELYVIPADGAVMFGPESYHLHDYGFFFNNFKQNVADRVKAFMEK